MKVYLDNCCYNRPFDDQEQMSVRLEAMRLLVEYLGAVNTERFIASIKNDRFDYTEWQRGLWNDKSIEDLHAEAAAFYHSRHAATEECERK